MRTFQHREKQREKEKSREQEVAPDVNPRMDYYKETQRHGDTEIRRKQRAVDSGY